MLEEVKSYLRITWNDEDSYIISIIDRGKVAINDLAGLEIDYATEVTAKSLLLDYCRYAYNNATEYFEENYQSQILRLQLKVAGDEIENQS